MIPFFSPIKHPKTFDFVCFQGEEKCPYHIETIPLICSANQWISFYMIGTSVTKELNKIKVIKWIKVFTWYFRITTTTTINFFFFFLLSGFSFRNIHESQDWIPTTTSTRFTDTQTVAGWLMQRAHLWT